MINPMIANEELCDVVISCYGLNPVLATRLIHDSNMRPQNKAYFVPENLQLFHDMRRYFLQQEILNKPE